MSGRIGRRDAVKAMGAAMAMAAGAAEALAQSARANEDGPITDETVCGLSPERGQAGGDSGAVPDPNEQ
jgi:hypothetical protein